ncbi:MAG: response regulator [Polyangiaceae bacterium]|nr:response regulator [Polyangiaceae bacterium]
MGDPRSSAEAARGASAGGVGVQQRRCRVLLVDSDLSALDSMEASLSRDTEVTTAMSGELALRLVEHTRFHLVCAEYKLPGMTGLELLERIVQHYPPKPGTVLITGASDYGPIQGQTRHYVLFRPFDPARLVSLILRLARLAEMKRSVQSLTDSLGPESVRTPSSRIPDTGRTSGGRPVEPPSSSDFFGGPRSTRAPRLTGGPPPPPPSSPGTAGRHDKS